MLTDLFQNLREFAISKNDLETANSLIPSQLIVELRESENGCLVQSFQELLTFDDTVWSFADKKDKCTKGYPCGRSCINAGKNCRNPVEGQAANYAGFLELQAKQSGKIADTKDETPPKTVGKYNVAEVRKRFLEGEEMTIDNPDGTTDRVKYVKDKDVNYLETYKGDNEQPSSRPLMTSEEAERYIDGMFKPQMIKAFGDPNPQFKTKSGKVVGIKDKTGDTGKNKPVKQDEMVMSDWDNKQSQVQGFAKKTLSTIQETPEYKELKSLMSGYKNRDGSLRSSDPEWTLRFPHFDIKDEKVGKRVEELQKQLQAKFNLHPIGDSNSFNRFKWEKTFDSQTETKKPQDTGKTEKPAASKTTKDKIKPYEDAAKTPEGGWSKGDADNKRATISQGLASLGNGLPDNPKMIYDWSVKHGVDLDDLLAKQGKKLTKKAVDAGSDESLALMEALYNDKPLIITPKPAVSKSGEERSPSAVKPKATTTAKLPKAESIKLPKKSDAQINYDDDNREYSLKVPGANKALSNPNAKVYSKEDADDLADYLTSPMPGTKEELGNAYQFRTGKLIKSQKDFDGEFKKVFDTLDKDSGNSGLVTVQKIRRALGDRLTRDDFDKYLAETQSGDNYQGVSGEVPKKDQGTDSVIKNRLDALYLPGTQPRTFIKRSDPDFSERPSQNFTWTRENINHYKAIAERQKLGV
jgi:hypothetical protein